MQLQMRLFKRAALDATLAPTPNARNHRPRVAANGASSRLALPRTAHDNPFAVMKGSCLRPPKLPNGDWEIRSLGRYLNQAFQPCLRWYGGRGEQSGGQGQGVIWLRSEGPAIQRTRVSVTRSARVG